MTEWPGDRQPWHKYRTLLQSGWNFTTTSCVSGQNDQSAVKEETRKESWRSALCEYHDWNSDTSTQVVPELAFP